jgi:hypothetical protein
MTMRIDQIPRNALELGLRGARLPLTVAETVLARGQDTSSWPPVLLFDKVEAGMKDIVGRATHDEALQAAAQLQRAEVAKREEALVRRTKAVEVAAGAAARADDRREQLGSEREALDAESAERTQQIEEAEREAHERAAREAAAKRSATRTTAAKRKKAVATQAARSDADRLRSEAEALRVEEASVEARGEALELDRAVEAKKAERRSR